MALVSALVNLGSMLLFLPSPTLTPTPAVAAVVEMLATAGATKSVSALVTAAVMPVLNAAVLSRFARKPTPTPTPAPATVIHKPQVAAGVTKRVTSLVTAAVTSVINAAVLFRFAHPLKNLTPTPALATVIHKPQVAAGVTKRVTGLVTAAVTSVMNAAVLFRFARHHPRHPLKNLTPTPALATVIHKPLVAAGVTTPVSGLKTAALMLALNALLLAAAPRKEAGVGSASAWVF